MNAYVVMANDFPSVVFSSRELAEEHAAKNRQQTEERRRAFEPWAYWRVLEFPILDVLP